MPKEKSAATPSELVIFRVVTKAITISNKGRR